MRISFDTLSFLSSFGDQHAKYIKTEWNRWAELPGNRVKDITAHYKLPGDMFSIVLAWS